MSEVGFGYYYINPGDVFFYFHFKIFFTDKYESPPQLELSEIDFEDEIVVSNQFSADKLYPCFKKLDNTCFYFCREIRSSESLMFFF